MDIEAMKRFPIEDFLARLGHHPVQRRANAIWYRSPYREEKTPSFKVNPEKNLWFDFGEGKGGNIFALAGEFIWQASSSRRATSSRKRGMWRKWRVCRHRTMDRKKPLIRTVPTDTASRMWRCCLYRTGRCSVTCKRGAYRPPSPLRTARRCATPRTASGISPWLSATKAAATRYATRSSRAACRRRT